MTKIYLVLSLLCFSIAALAQSKEIEIKRVRRTKKITDAIASVQKSIVGIYSYSSANPSAQDMGTGFVVNKQGYVITNYHVIKKSYKSNDKIALCRFMTSNNIYGTTDRDSAYIKPCQIIDVDSLHDLALLKTFDLTFVNKNKKQEPLFEIANITDKPVVDGTRIVISGYPLLQINLISTVGYIASSYIKFSYISSQLSVLRNAGVPFRDDAYLADIQISAGMSGGPVYIAETGEIIGVCVSYVQSPVEASLQLKNEYIELIRKSKSAEELKVISEIIQFFSATQIQSSGNSGISTVIPIKFAIRLLEKNKVEL